MHEVRFQLHGEFLLSRRTLSSTTIRREKASDTLALYALGMESFCSIGPRDSMQKPFSSSCGTFARSVAIREEGSSLFAIMPDTTMPSFIGNGGTRATAGLPSISFHPTVPKLNPIERVWKLVRRMATHNRYCSSLDETTPPVESIFHRWHYGNNILSSLRDYLRRCVWLVSNLILYWPNRYPFFF